MFLIHAHIVYKSAEDGSGFFPDQCNGVCWTSFYLEWGGTGGSDDSSCEFQ